MTRIPVDIVEVIARRGRHRDVVYAGRARKLLLPSVGAAEWSDTYVTLATRPDRWWVIGPVSACAETAARIAGLLGTGVVTVDQSSGYDLLDLTGDDWRAALATGCRLDLDPEVFGPGQVAATVIAQVNVILIPHPAGQFLLTPSTLTQHVEEWLSHLGGISQQANSDSGASIP
jgi:sarcosine oxidase subunit gamma